MVRVRPENRSQNPEDGGFRPDSIVAGNTVMFFDSQQESWQVAVLNGWENPPRDQDGNWRFRVFNGASVDNVAMDKPPRKLDLPLTDLNIGGKIYRVDRNSFNIVDVQRGEVEVNLVNVADSSDVLPNVKAETLANFSNVSKLETDLSGKITALKREIHTKADARAKNVLKGLTDIEKKVAEASEKLGALADWQEIGAVQATQLGKDIKALQKEVNDKLTELKNELDSIEPAKSKTAPENLRDEATGTIERIDFSVRKANKTQTDSFKQKKKDATTEYKKWQDEIKKWNDAVTAHENSKAKHAEWTKKQAASGAGNGKAQPAEPVVIDHPSVDAARWPHGQPAEPENPADMVSDFEDDVKRSEIVKIFEDLRSNPPTSKHQELVKKAEDILDKKFKRQGFVGGYKDATLDSEQAAEAIAEVFMQVLNEEKSRNDSEFVVEKTFDVKKEKTELLATLKNLRDRADKLKLTSEVARLDAGKVRIDGLESLPEADQQKAVLQFIESLGEVELVIYTAERDAAGTGEIKVEKAEQKDIDIPDILIRDLMYDRTVEMRAVMAAIYSSELTAEGRGTLDNPEVRSALKDLMKRQPDASLLVELRKYGIKDWDSFRKLWDDKMHVKAGEVMMKWGKADLRDELARQTTALDQLRALKWQIGARVLTNVALVGGGAFLATTALATGGLGGVALAAAGGAVGGGLRAGLQKILFGSKWLEDRKAAQLEELADRKRREIVNQTLADRFGAGAAPAPTADCQTMFAAILAEAVRVGSAEAGLIKGEGTDFSSEEAKSLHGDAKRVYIKALKTMRESAEPSEAQKIQLAIAVEALIARGESSVIEAAKNTDPAIIKMLDGIMAGYSGAGASKENYGWSGAAATTAVGAAVGVAFFSNSTAARGEMGALGGTLMGYKFGESRMKKQEFAEAQTEFTATINTLNQSWDRYFTSGRGGLTSDEFTAFTDGLKEVSRLLKGNSDTTRGHRIIAMLNNSPRLKQQAENLVYQAYRHGVFAQATLERMQAQSEAVLTASNLPSSLKDREFWIKSAKRVGYGVSGALIGAGSAILLGKGAQEMGKDFRHNVLNSYGHKEAPIIYAKHTHTSEGLAATAEATAPARSAQGEVMSTTGNAAPEAAQAVAPEVQTTHEEIILEKPDTIHDYQIKGGGSTWKALDQLHKSGKTDVFKGWSAAKFETWRHEELERLGYNFKGHGVIEHPIQVHKGAAVELYQDSDGKPHIRFSEDSIRDGKVEILDKYKVEHHDGDNTEFKKGDTTPKVETKPVPKDLSADEFKKGHWQNKSVDVDHQATSDETTVKVTPDTNGNFVGSSGEVYEPVWNINDKSHVGLPPLFKDKAGNLFDAKTGQYDNTVDIADRVIAKLSGNGEMRVASGGGNTEWTKGPALEQSIKDKVAAEIKGTMIEKKVTITDTAKAAETVAAKTAAPVVERPVVASASEAVVDRQEVVGGSIPEQWQSHSAQYSELSALKGNLFSESALSKSHLNALLDQKGMINNLIDRIQTTISNDPKLFENSNIIRALDSSANIDPLSRLEMLAENLNGKGLVLDTQDKLILGGSYTNGTEFEHSTMTVTTADGVHELEFTTVKDGGKAFSVYDAKTGLRSFISPDLDMGQTIDKEFAQDFYAKTLAG